MRVGDSQQALSVGGGVECLNVVSHRLGVLAQPEAAASEVGQNPRLEIGVRMAAMIKPVERPPVGLDRGIESLFDLVDGADLRIDRGIQFRVIKGSRGRSVLQGCKRRLILPKLRQGHASNPLQIRSFIGGRRQPRRFRDDIQRLGGLLRPDRQLGGLAEQRQRRCQLIRHEVRKGLAQSVRNHAKLRKRWGRVVTFDLADEPFGGESTRELFLGEPLGQAGLSKTLSN